MFLDLIWSCVCCRWEDHPADSGSDQIRVIWDHQKDLFAPEEPASVPLCPVLPVCSGWTPADTRGHPQGELMVAGNSYSHWGGLYHMQCKHMVEFERKKYRIMLPNVEINGHIFTWTFHCVMADIITAGVNECRHQTEINSNPIEPCQDSFLLSSSLTATASTLCLVSVHRLNPFSKGWIYSTSHLKT